MARLGRPSAIVSFREYGCVAAAILSVELGLPTNPVDAVEAVRDKAQMRRLLFNDPQLSLPFYEGERGSLRCTLAKEMDNGPWIVKPCDRSGSEFVSLVADRQQLEVWYAKTAGAAVLRWIAEPFLDGPEVSIEGVSFAGRHHFLGITAKETTGHPGFVELGHCFPAETDAAGCQALYAVAGAALTRLRVSLGASHTEIKIDTRRGPILVETHTRPGGDCIPELVTLACGLSQYELAIQSLFADTPPDALRERTAPTAAAAVHFLTPPPGIITGMMVDDVAALTDAVRWRINANLVERTAPLRSSADRAGYVISRGRDASEAVANARAAATAIRFRVRSTGGDPGAP